MSLSFDDRILGEKVNNYCSSSDGEGNDSDEASNNCDVECFAPPSTIPASLGNQVAQVLLRIINNTEN
nr:hypothetical transcript [Hymenolepis microstoma]